MKPDSNIRFRTFVGVGYETSEVKVLVLGASHYCNHKCCELYNKCTMPNGLSVTFDKCKKGNCTEADMQDEAYLSKVGQLCKKPLFRAREWNDLRNYNARMICEDLLYTEASNQRYTHFTSWLAGRDISENIDDKIKLFKDFAFTEYIDHFINQVVTPKCNESFYFETFKQTLREMEIRPDIILVWGAPVREALIKNCNLENRKGFRIIEDVEIDRVKYTLVFITHPSYRLFNQYREEEFADFQKAKRLVVEKK